MSTGSAPQNPSLWKRVREAFDHELRDVGKVLILPALVFLLPRPP